MDWFPGGWMLNPGLLALGGLLAAAPVIIHLLNRRKYRVVEWAALDFLRQAEQRNRRRVQLEDLLLLLLRCLAILLCGLFVARPFLPSGMTAGFLSGARVERIVLLDDSPSMDASSAGTTPFQRARGQLLELAKAASERASGDTFTLCLTSRPDQPVVQQVLLSQEQLPELVSQIEGLTTSDVPSKPADALARIETLLLADEPQASRMMYVLSDLREGDWNSVERSGTSLEMATSGSGPVVDALVRIAGKLVGCYVVDTGTDAVRNLSILDLMPEDRALLAGRTVRMVATVLNSGPDEVRDLPVELIAGERLPLQGRIDSIPGGETGTVPFSLTLPHGDGLGEDPIPLPIKVSLKGETPDALPADNSRLYAARIQQGLSTLIVDGDPSEEFGHAESFFLQRALAPPGTSKSGFQLEVITPDQLARTPLDRFELICLCNVARLEPAVVTALEDRIRSGGGLVIFPGDQVDPQAYSQLLYREGNGLLPRPFQKISGDESEQTWTSLVVTRADHPGLQVFQGDAAALLETPRFFQWWTMPAQGGGSVLLDFSLTERTPALVEQSFGEGKVLQFATPADSAWSNWPEDPGFLILLQELYRSLVRSDPKAGQWLAGDSASEVIDLSRHRPEVRLKTPDQQTTTLVATRTLSTTDTAVGSEQGQTGGSRVRDQWVVQTQPLRQRGFYSLQLQGAAQSESETLLAVNLHPQEGNLTRMSASVLQQGWQGSGIRLVTGDSLVNLIGEAGRGEMWRVVLLVLAIVLFCEQGLVWLIGRNR